MRLVLLIGDGADVTVGFEPPQGIVIRRQDDISQIFAIPVIFVRRLRTLDASNVLLSKIG